MKKSFLGKVLFFAAAALLVLACSKDDNNDEAMNQNDMELLLSAKSQMSINNRPRCR